VVHGMDGALELEIVEFEELGDEDVRVEPLEEPDAPQTTADAERADPRRPLVQSGIVRVRRHIADRLAQLGGQMPDEVSPMMPVLAALGVEDDPAVAARQPPEGAILPPAPEECPGHSPSRSPVSLGDELNALRRRHRQPLPRPPTVDPRDERAPARGTNRS